MATAKRTKLDLIEGMPKTTLAGEKTTLAGEKLPKVGKWGKNGIQARRDLDWREREVFQLRRDGYTFQEIADTLIERAEQALERDGKKIIVYTSLAGIKDAYDRYLRRCPERFDLAGRKEQLELAIQRAEENYRNARERSFKAQDSDGAIDEAARARWSNVAGKWFDRLSKLRAITEDTTIINNFSQNNMVHSDSELIAKLTAFVESSIILVPDLNAYKSADTVPPMIDAPTQEFEDAEIITDDGEFDEPEPEAEIDIVQPVGNTQHEAIRTAGTLANINFTL